MFDLMILQSSLNMDHIKSKTRSIGQISLKPCSASRGSIVALIIMKLYQNVCLDDILVEFEYRSCRVKIRSLGKISLKYLLLLRGHSFASILMKLYKIV